MIKELETVWLPRNKYHITFSKYSADNSTCISIEDDNGEPMMRATVCMPDYEIPENHVVIKDYSENEGILNALINVGIIDKPVGYIPSGYVNLPVCPLLVK